MSRKKRSSTTADDLGATSSVIPTHPYDTLDIVLISLLTFFATLALGLIVGGAVYCRWSRRWQRDREANASRSGALRMLLALRGGFSRNNRNPEAHEGERLSSYTDVPWGTLSATDVAAAEELLLLGDSHRAPDLHVSEGNSISRAGAKERTALLQRSADLSRTSASPQASGTNAATPNYGTMQPNHHHTENHESPGGPTPHLTSLVGTALPQTPPQSSAAAAATVCQQGDPTTTTAVPPRDQPDASANSEDDELAPFQPRDEKDKTVLNTTHDSRYQIVKHIGDGAFSSVYLVKRKQGGERKKYAMKYLICADDRQRLAAIRECETINSLQGHPNVIRLVDMFMNFDFQATRPPAPVGGEGTAGAAVGGGDAFAPTSVAGRREKDAFGQSATAFVRALDSRAASRVGTPRLGAIVTGTNPIFPATNTTALVDGRGGLMTPKVTYAQPSHVTDATIRAPHQPAPSPWSQPLLLPPAEDDAARGTTRPGVDASALVSPESPTPYWTRIPLGGQVLEKALKHIGRATGDGPSDEKSQEGALRKNTDAQRVLHALATAAAGEVASTKDKAGVAAGAKPQNEQADNERTHSRGQQEMDTSNRPPYLFQAALAESRNEEDSAEASSEYGAMLMLSEADTERLMMEARRRYRRSTGKRRAEGRPQQGTTKSAPSAAQCTDTTDSGALGQRWLSISLPRTPREDKGNADMQQGNVAPSPPASAHPSPLSTENDAAPVSHACLTTTEAVAHHLVTTNNAEPAHLASCNQSDEGDRGTKDGDYPSNNNLVEIIDGNATPSGSSLQVRQQRGRPRSPVVRTAIRDASDRGSSHSASRSSLASEEEPLQPVVRTTPSPQGRLGHAAGSFTSWSGASGRPGSSLSSPISRADMGNVGGAQTGSSSYAPRRVLQGATGPHGTSHMAAAAFPTNFNAFLSEVKDAEGRDSLSVSELRTGRPQAQPTDVSHGPFPRVASTGSRAAPAGLPTSPGVRETGQSSIQVTHTGRNYNMNFTQAQNLQLYQQHQRQEQQDVKMQVSAEQAPWVRGVEHPENTVKPLGTASLSYAPSSMQTHGGTAGSVSASVRHNDGKGVSPALTMPNMKVEPRINPNGNFFPKAVQGAAAAAASSTATSPSLARAFHYNANVPLQATLHQKPGGLDTMLANNALADLATFEEKSRMTGNVVGFGGVRYYSPIIGGGGGGGGAGDAPNTSPASAGATGGGSAGLFGDHGTSAGRAMHYTNFPIASTMALGGETLLTRAQPPPPSTLVIQRDARTGALINPYAQKTASAAPAPPPEHNPLTATVARSSYAPRSTLLANPDRATDTGAPTADPAPQLATDNRTTPGGSTVRYHDFDAKTHAFNRPFIPLRDERNRQVTTAAGTIERHTPQPAGAERGDSRPGEMTPITQQLALRQELGMGEDPPSTQKESRPISYAPARVLESFKRVVPCDVAVGHADGAAAALRFNNFAALGSGAANAAAVACPTDTQKTLPPTASKDPTDVAKPLDVSPAHPMSVAEAIRAARAGKDGEQMHLFDGKTHLPWNNKAPAAIEDGTSGHQVSGFLGVTAPNQGPLSNGSRSGASPASALNSPALTARTAVPSRRLPSAVDPQPALNTVTTERYAPVSRPPNVLARTTAYVTPYGPPVRTYHTVAHPNAPQDVGTASPHTPSSVVTNTNTTISSLPRKQHPGPVATAGRVGTNVAGEPSQEKPTLATLSLHPGPSSPWNGSDSRLSHSAKDSDASSSFPTHKGYLCLVMEYHPMGDLCRYVLKNKKAQEERKQFLQRQRQQQVSGAMSRSTIPSSVTSSAVSKHSELRKAPPPPPQQQQQLQPHRPSATTDLSRSRSTSPAGRVLPHSTGLATSSNALSDTVSRSKHETTATTTPRVPKPVDPTADNPLTEAQLLSIAFQLASVLHHMHSQSPPVVHRDLKPENILIKGDPKELLMWYQGMLRDVNKEGHEAEDEASPPIAGSAAPTQASDRKQGGGADAQQAVVSQSLPQRHRTQTVESTSNSRVPSPPGRHPESSVMTGEVAASSPVSATAVRHRCIRAHSPCDASSVASPVSVAPPSSSASSSQYVLKGTSSEEKDPILSVRVWRNIIPIVVTDFGLAIVQEAQRRQGRGGGTRPYIAPESWKGETSTASDVWGYGCVLYALATGRLTARNVRIMSEEATKKERNFASMVLNDLLASKYSLAFASFVVSLLVVDPAKRPTAAMAAQCFRVVEDEDGEDLVIFDETSPFFSNVLDL